MKTPFLKLISLGTLFVLSAVLSACNPSTTKFDDEFNATVQVSHVYSLLSVSSSSVFSGGAVTIQLSLKDNNFNPYISNLPQVSFQASGGTSTGTIGPITNQGNGSYTASFTGATPGTATTIRAFVDGVEIQSTPPTITVTSGNYSLANSTIGLSAATVSSGATITATLTVRDASNNPLASGGLTVVFTNSGGTSTGTWSATTDLNNGTYSAVFTGAVGGTATTVSASIQGSPITSALPTITVSGGSATKLVFTTEPSASGTAGTTLGTQPVVTVQDSNSNTVTSSSDSVVLTLFSDSNCTTAVATAPSGVNSISGTATVAASSGVATFAGLAITRAHATLYFKATSGSLTTDCSSAISIAPASINTIIFSTQPAPTTNDTDTSFTTQPVITARDVYENTATNNSTASITLTAYSDACVTAVASGLAATANPVTLSSGVATFAAVKTLKTNIVRIGASDGTRTACSSALTVTPGVPSTLTISSGNSPTQTAAHGVALGSPFVVLLRDANNNVIPSTQINWAVTAGGGTLGSGATVNTDSSGLSSNLLTNGIPGAQTVTATVNGYALLTQTFTATATTTGFTQTWPFDALPDPTLTYAFDGTKIDFTGGVSRLTASDQLDDSGTASGFTGGTGSSSVGVATYGALSGEPASSGLKLGNNGSCNGASASCANAVAPELYELNSTWTPQWASLVGYWKMNNNWNDSVGARNGTPINGATFTSSSKVGAHAGVFDGTDDYVSIPNLGLTSGTVSFWMNPSSVVPTDARLFSQSTGGGAGAIRINGTNIQTWSTVSWLTLGGGGTIPSANTWYHLTFVYSGGNCTLYVNGVARNTVATAFNFSGAAMGIGQRYNDVSGTTFSGSMDDFAVWSAALTAAEVAQIYQRQSIAYSGVYTSRIMDAYQAGQNWTSLGWTAPLPFYKPLTDFSGGSLQNETTTQYSSLNTNSLMTGLIGLWHLDETSGTSFADSSGSNFTGTSANSPSIGAPGRFRNAVIFNQGGVTNQRININNPVITGSGDFTISAWILPTPANAPNGNIAGNWSGGNPAGIQFYFTAPNLIRVYDGTTSADCAHGMTGARWYNVVATRKSGVVQILRDGVSLCSQTVAGTVTGSTNLNIGGNFLGGIDEVAIWSRALGDGTGGTPNEIQQLYQRGASRIKFQARSCAAADPTCAAASWKGPDGSANTYFSELYNMSTQAATPSGTVNATPPSMVLQNYSSPVAANRYFQYRTILESASATAALQPELKSVTVGPAHYDTASPTVVSKTGVSFYSLSNLIQNGNNALTAQCPGGTTYNLGVGASYLTATWYWWDSSKASDCTTPGTGAWCSIVTEDAAKSNAASVVATNASTFPGPGTVYFKAFLKSSGSPCELDSLSLSGQQ